MTIDGTLVRVDSMHEILVNKLTALLARAEVRDLVDVRALLAAGADLEAGLRDAPRKDGGFSPLTLAWVLTSLELEPLASELGWAPDAIASLDAFKVDLVDRLTAALLGRDRQLEQERVRQRVESAADRIVARSHQRLVIGRLLLVGSATRPTLPVDRAHRPVGGTRSGRRP